MSVVCSAGSIDMPVTIEPEQEHAPLQLSEEDQALIMVPVLVDGEVIAYVQVDPTTSTEDMEKLALEDPYVQEEIRNRQISHVVAIPFQYVNVVVA